MGDKVDPRIPEILENDDNLMEYELTFQHDGHDGATPFYAFAVLQYLNK